MSQNAGDKSRESGLSDTFTNGTADEIPAGAFVGVTGENEIAPVDVNDVGGDALVGVVNHAIPAGEADNVHLSGAPWGLIDDAVSAGDELGAPDSSGTGATTPGVAGVGTDDVHVLETATDTDGNYIGRVVLE